MASKPVIPQNDNVAHALAGAGGGILSMVLTYVPTTRTSVPSPHLPSSCLYQTPYITRHTTVFHPLARNGYLRMHPILFHPTVPHFIHHTSLVTGPKDTPRTRKKAKYHACAIAAANV